MKILPILLATVAAAAAGAAHGARPPSAPAAAAAVVQPAVESGAIKSTEVRDLKPIITNLAAPAGAWIRLELGVLLTAGEHSESDLPIREFADDTLSYLRALTAAQLEGVGGIRRLREDLNERAALRSHGGIREVLIETLVVQ